MTRTGIKIAGVLLAAAVMAIVLRSDRPAESWAQTARRSGDLIVLPTPVDDQFQLVYIVDPAVRAMAVYRMEVKSGKLKLEAVRQFKWDLQLNQLDSDNPTPDAVREMVEAQQ